MHHNAMKAVDDSSDSLNDVIAGSLLGDAGTGSNGTGHGACVGHAWYSSVALHLSRKSCYYKRKQ